MPKTNKKAFALVGAVLLAIAGLVFIPDVWRKMKADRVVRILSARHPGRHFAPVTKSAVDLPINAIINGLKVETASLQRDQELVQVTIGMISVKKSCAPIVDVALYDGSAKLVAKGRIVDHLYSDVKPTSLTKTTDYLRMSQGSKVAAIEVSGGCKENLMQ